MTKASKPIVIITGSAGNIGTALTAALKNEYEIVGFDQEDKKCDIPIDLTSASSIKLAFKIFREMHGNKIAALIHLAAYFNFTGEDSPLYEKVNVKGTKQLIIELQDFEVDRFIFTSTMLLHEPCMPGERIDENTPINPKWFYPKSKILAEKAIKTYHGKIPYLILRLAGLYDDSSCVPTLAQQISRIYERSIKAHLYAGDLNAGQSFIHQEDLTELIKAALHFRQKLPRETILLAGEPDAVSYNKLQHIIGNLIHDEDEWQTFRIPAPLAKIGAWIEEKTEPIVPDDFDQGEKPFIRPFMINFASDHYALDISHARQLLDWEPKHTIKDTLPKIIDALKKNPKKWYKENAVVSPDWVSAAKNINAENIRNQYEKKYRKEHKQFLWAPFFNIGMGAWLITSPHTLNYGSQYLTYSDIISGILVIIFSIISLSWRYGIARLMSALVGLWLIFAPLIYWAPTAGAYLNDTLIGSIVIGLSILTRPAVGVSPIAAMTGPVIPPGWDFSPSSWIQRIPIIVLAYIGFFISRYLTAYQLEHVNGIWEPFFLGKMSDPKNGTEEIITSYISKAWPVPDAGLGAVTYILEILTGFIGGANRWRTMPWLVLLFGFMIIPLGAVSITFIIIQPILLNTWCTLCLIAAIAMLLQIPYSFDEIIATCIFLWQRYQAGRPILRILFVGDTDKGSHQAKNIDNFAQPKSAILKDMLTGGVSFPWNLLASLLIGVWLMFTSLILNTKGAMANADHLIGALIITVTFTAFAEVMRPIRFLNLLLGLALFITPFVYTTTTLSMISSIISGCVLCFFTFRKGKIKNNYGIWSKVIK